MENTPARRRLNNIHRPQIYVNVEFGVSWSQSNVPNKHGITYRSRILKERAPNFPRHVPPTNTNYLAAPSHEQQRSSNYPYGLFRHHHRQHQQQQGHHHQQQSHRGHEGPEERRQHARHISPEDEALEERRSSRDSRSSHERGRSAPPPINDSPWDISTLEGSGMPLSSSRPAATFPVAAASTAATGSQPQPMVWKDLPEVPSRFRLGEDGMPWSSWTWPMGYDPDADADEARPSPSEYTTREGGAAALSPPPLPAAAAQSPPFEMPRRREVESQRNRELEALSTAMMTIDNGFENQWWNQGQRETTSVAATLSPNSATPPTAWVLSGASLGWAVADERRDTRFSSSTMGAVVSPVTAGDYDYYSSPPPLYQQLSRTMSTRSEELFLVGGRYA